MKLHKTIKNQIRIAVNDKVWDKIYFAIVDTVAKHTQTKIANKLSDKIHTLVWRSVKNDPAIITIDSARNHGEELYE